MAILLTNKGKKVKTSENDPYLAKWHRSQPYMDNGYTSGDDLYYHRSRNGNDYYYIDSWSMWQRDSKYKELITKSQALQFLLEFWNEKWLCRNDELIEKLFPDINEEDA